ncbi:MAG: prepilin-type N-terminal cleavage/methylation domain-containing protein [Culicoidibacterales bacterium]
MKVNNQKGVSLVEIIAALAIIGIVAVAFSTSIGVMTRNEQYSKKIQHTTQVGQTIMENLANEGKLPTGNTYAGIDSNEGAIVGEARTVTYEGTYQEKDTVLLKFSNPKSLDDEPQAIINITSSEPIEMKYSSGSESLSVTGLQPITIEPNPDGQIIIQINDAAASASVIRFDPEEQEFKILWNKINPESKLTTYGPVQVYDVAKSTKLGTLYEVEVTVNAGKPEAFTTTRQIILQTE